MDLSEIRQDNGGRHPWEIARARAIERLARGYGPPRISDVLDFGCGDGFTGRWLLEQASGNRYVGFDTNLSPEQCAKWTEPGRQLWFFNQEPPIDARFDAVLLCDVIEHVEDVTSLLQSAWSRVRNGGVLVVTVPAFQSLFSNHDRALKHFRRYSLSGLAAAVRQVSLPIAASGYLFGSLLLPRALSVAVERLRRSPDRGDAVENEQGIGGWTGGRFVTHSVASLLAADCAVLLALSRVGIKVPGLTAWTVCRRLDGEP